MIYYHGFCNLAISYDAANEKCERSGYIRSFVLIHFSTVLCIPDRFSHKPLPYPDPDPENADRRLHTSRKCRSSMTVRAEPARDARRSRLLSACDSSSMPPHAYRTLRRNSFPKCHTIVARFFFVTDFIMLRRCEPRDIADGGHVVHEHLYRFRLILLDFALYHQHGHRTAQSSCVDHNSLRMLSVS